MPKKPDKDIAQEWLRHHKKGFETAAAQCKSRYAGAHSWFSAQVDQLTATSETLESGSRATFRTAVPLYVDKVRPRHWFGACPTLTAYLALEADLEPRLVHNSSLKLGLLDGDRVIFRVLYDYDRVGGEPEHGFPFHVQWGKPPGEVRGRGAKAFYEAALDEPRLPIVPIDIFLLMQVLHDQFHEPPLVSHLQSLEWTGVLKASTAFLARRWCEAITAVLRNGDAFLPMARSIQWPHLEAISV